MEEGNKEVEGTGEKPKGLIDEIWWIIPPAFVVFIFLPYLSNICNFSSFSIECYLKELRWLYFYNTSNVLSIEKTRSNIWLFYYLGFMAVGMLLVRRRSLVLRIIVPIIFVFLGNYILYLLFYLLWVIIGMPDL